MIEEYKIKKINGEERLYIYLDINFEFSSINNKSLSLKTKILEFLKKNKIKFQGTIISIFIGGVFVGNLVLNKPLDNKNSNYFYKPSILEVDKMLHIPDTVLVENSNLQKNNQEINDDNIINEELKPNDENTVIINEKGDSKTSIKQNKTTNKVDVNAYSFSTNKNNDYTIQSETTISSDNTKTEIKQETTPEVKQEVVDNNTYVNIKRKDGNIEKIELETYIIGVVGAEMPASFHNEALKSQAIIARTYALKAIRDGKQLTDTESTQSYKSDLELKSMWGSSFTTYYNKIKNCVLNTKGLYLTYNGSYIEAVYHSTSNGRTESSTNVWNNYYPYLVSVESIYDSLNQSFIVDKTFTYQEVSDKLGINVDMNSEFKILDLTEGNRVSKINVNGNIFTGVEFRQKLGLRSADFTIIKNLDSLKITTKGYGHGVGLSQYGANGYAKNGMSYIDILKHYYPNVTISHK